MSLIFPKNIKKHSYVINGIWQNDRHICNVNRNGKTRNFFQYMISIYETYTWNAIKSFSVSCNSFLLFLLLQWLELCFSRNLMHIQIIWHTRNTLGDFSKSPRIYIISYTPYWEIIFNKVDLQKWSNAKQRCLQCTW